MGSLRSPRVKVKTWPAGNAGDRIDGLSARSSQRNWSSRDEVVEAREARTMGTETDKVNSNHNPMEDGALTILVVIQVDMVAKVQAHGLMVARQI